MGDAGVVASEAREPLSPRYWVLFVLTLVYLINLIDRSIVYILQEGIKAEFQLADWQVGLIGGTAFGLFYAFMGLPIARLAERRSRVKIVSVAVFVWSLLTALCGAAQSFAQLLLVRAGVAIGEAGGSPPSHSVISDYFPPNKRATALSIYTLAVPLGLLSGAVIGGSIAQMVGWRMTFVIVGLPGIAAALLVLTLREPPRGNSDAVPTLDQDAEPPGFGAVLARARTMPGYLHVVAGSSVAAFAAYGVTSFTAAWLVRKFELELSLAGLAFGLIFGVAAGIGTLCGGAMTDRWARRDRRAYGWLPAICLAMAGPFFILGFAQDNWLAATLMLMLPGLLATCHYGSTFATVQNSFGARMRSTATALTFLAHAIIGMSLGPLFTGFASDLLASFALGDDFSLVCTSAPASADCRAASALGLEYALMIVSGLFLWASLHFLMAARHLAAAGEAPQ